MVVVSPPLQSTAPAALAIVSATCAVAPIHYLVEIVRITGTVAGKIGFLLALENKF